MPSVVIDVEARVAQALDNLERVGQAGADAAKKMNAAFSVAKASIVGLVSAVSVDALVGKFNDAVSSLAKLDDAAEMTGASVESLSSILNTLKPSGIGLDQITDVAGKLTRAMQGADEETSKAAKALEALKVETRDTAGNLRPVDEVLKELADSLSGYADGTNKVALVQAIFGKSGAALLPMLKDLAATQKQVATVTTEQAAEAERLEKAMAKLAQGSEKLWQSLASKLIPSLADLIDRFNKAGDAGLGFISKVFNTATRDTELDGAIKQKTEQIESLRKVLAREEQGYKTGVGIQRDQAAIDRTKAQIAEEERLLKVLQDRKYVLDAMGQRSKEDRGFTPDLQAPKLQADADKNKDKLSDGERYVRNLQQQITHASELTEREKLLADIRIGRVKFDTAAQQKRAEDYARLLDFAKQESQIEKEIARERDADVKAQQEALDKQVRAAEQRDEALGRLTEKYRGMIDPLKSYREQLQEISDLEARGNLTASEAVDARVAVNRDMLKTQEHLADKSRSTIDLAKDFGVTFESAFEKAIFGAGKLSDALKGLLQDISRLIIRKTLIEPLIGNILSGLTLGGAAYNTGGQTYDSFSGDLPDVVLAAKSSSRSGATIVQYITNQGGASPAEMAQFGENIKNATLRAVAERERR